MATGALALVLTACLAFANAPLPILAVVELAAAMLWISAVINAVFLAALILLWFPLRRLLGLTASDWTAFLAAGLAALHVTWALLNRLTLAQSWIRPPRFMTWPGVLQCVALLVLAGCLMMAGVAFRNHGNRRVWKLLLGVSVVLGGGCLTWDSLMEVHQRVYPMEEIRAATSSERGPTVQDSEERQRVIVLAIDGLSWAVMKPLLTAGKLPSFARLIEQGAIGYLDNGTGSYSPQIWNTIFSGRPDSEHGIYGFRKIVLPYSEQHLRNLVLMPPTLHAFYGLRHLAELIPNPGLWRMATVRSTDRRVKTVWEVASAFEKRVLVANTLTSRPVQPVPAEVLEPVSGSAQTLPHPPVQCDLRDQCPSTLQWGCPVLCRPRPRPAVHVYPNPLFARSSDRASCDSEGTDP